ncbi:MAG: LysM peptidoglycan-binding domain-containing protein [Bacteroidales bacterium]|nr:LysM peptidoglycan-binding domain-containing protein [Bacteroidales bacterium]
MKYRIWIILLSILLIHSAYAQNNEGGVLKIDSTTSNSEDIDYFTRQEIRKMDSMLNTWYVSNELAKHSSVLSKLKDDTTVYDNNDSMIFKRLSQIVTAVPLAYNDKVKRYIELYSVQRQRSSSVILGLAQYYYPWMREIFDKYDVPEELVYITIIESALNPNAVSPAGATGIWQFMYGTGKIYDLQVSTFVDDRRDPYKATDAAARHLRDLYNIFNDWGLAISAYNCGAGNVRKAIQRSGGKTDFWGVSPFLPRETQNYFPAFIGALYMMTYHNLYGISPAPISFPTDVDTVMVDKELHFGQISEVLGISTNEIKSLNPQYKRDIIPAYNEKYPLRLRSADIIRFLDLKDSVEKYKYDEFFNPTKDLNKENLATNSNGDIVKTTPSKYHTVRKGETLSSIARKYGTSYTTIKSLNHLRSNTLRVGQKLLIKKGTTIVVKQAAPPKVDSTSTVTDTTASPTNKTNIEIEEPIVVNKDTTKVIQPTTPTIRIHIVKKGETLYSIARKYGKTAAALASFNHLQNENSIKIGQKIKIPIQ